MKKEAKGQLKKSSTPKEASNKSKKKKVKRFTKAQIESIRNSPMFVKKRKAAEKFFASPGYKVITRERAVKKQLKGFKSCFVDITKSILPMVILVAKTLRKMILERFLNIQLRF